MDEEPLISRAELKAMLFSIHDINANIGRLVSLIFGGDDGEDGKEDDPDT